MTHAADIRKVLVVDDEIHYRELFEEFFFGRDYSVHTAGDGRSAKLLLEKYVYDLIFIDCNMPEMSGVEVAKVLQSMPDQGKTIMISGYDLIDEEFTRNLDVDVFLKKPFSFTEIKDLLA